jgi:predicted nucleic acid-binding protein
MALTVLDAGIVIAILDSRDRHHAVASQAATRALARGDELVVPVSAYAEILVAPYRRGPDAVATVDAFLAALPARIEPATREIASAAAKLRARHGPGLRLPDALVIATAIALGAASLLTTDAGWPKLPISVEVVG